MTDTGSDLVLDGNAAAGLLRGIFVEDVTTAEMQCDHCGATGPVGGLHMYAAAMGAVLRCTQCEAVVIRVVSTPHGRWLDMTGARHLRL